MFRLFLLGLLVWFGAVSICQAESYNAPRQLSLEEAIYLAVRQNPNVQTAQLNHVISKFSLEVQQWQFRPHFALQATRTTSRNYSVTPGGYVTSNVTAIQPSVSLLTPIGTQASLTATNNISSTYNPGVALQIIQPLMRGFGKPIVEAALYDAMDSEKISRLNVENTVRTTVTSVINAYLDVVSAQHTLDVDQNALKRAETSEQQTKLFIKAGHKAGVELVTVQADVANAQTRIESDKNNLAQSRYALLTTIGIDPSSNVTVSSIDLIALIKKFHIPTLAQTKERMLANDIEYQVAQITLQGATKRSILAADDATRWQLNLTLNGSSGNGNGGGPNAGLNSLVNGVNQSDSAMLTLNIPIDDRAAKNSLAIAKISFHEAEIALQQEKWSKETNAINGWNSIFSAKRGLYFAENAERLQDQTYTISFKKYSYGLIDSLELQSAQQQLSAAQQSLVNAQINYLKSLVNLDLLLGSTLQTWDVKVRYS